ncbi:MAG TPA: glycosyl hydrolase family 65 protein [Ktedonobacteraceae bacterium]|nr:glycosyl hydrolase family 65 protein [Ktedonobacteraceae bacterium]
MLILSADHLPVPYRENADWFLHSIPFFECPDPSFQKIYYFRWDVYRKHIKHTPEGYVVTEFLPAVSWAGIYNTINATACHHLYEGRWLRTHEYLDDYARFWFHAKGATPRLYSAWLADALYARFLVTGDAELLITLLDDLVHNYTCWEREHLDANGLFWQCDDRDGMEYQISGSGCRPTINSYMFGDAVAIARIAELAGRAELAATYMAKAASIKALVQEHLWDPQAQFFKTLPTETALEAHRTFYADHPMEPHYAAGKLVDVREIQGYLPWYFLLPDTGYEAAWLQLRDSQGFAAPYGPSTAERRHPYWWPAPTLYQHDCLWRGSSWPFATSQTLTALANLLNAYQQSYVSAHDYFTLLQGYVHTQYLRQQDGSVIPWIDESAHPDTGAWVTRETLYERGSKDKDRGRDYNHSTFVDHIISGLLGLRPRQDDMIELRPLLPQGTWDYFCLDGVCYHGHLLTILYDHDGSHYEKGSGFQLFVDGKLAVTRSDLGTLQLILT